MRELQVSLGKGRGGPRVRVSGTVPCTRPPAQPAVLTGCSFEPLCLNRRAGVTLLVAGEIGFTPGWLQGPDRGDGDEAGRGWVGGSGKQRQGPRKLGGTGPFYFLRPSGRWQSVRVGVGMRGRGGRGRGQVGRAGPGRLPGGGPGGGPEPAARARCGGGASESPPHGPGVLTVPWSRGLQRLPQTLLRAWAAARAPPVAVSQPCRPMPAVPAPPRAQLPSLAIGGASGQGETDESAGE